MLPEAFHILLSAICRLLLKFSGTFTVPGASKLLADALHMLLADHDHLLRYPLSVCLPVSCRPFQSVNYLSENTFQSFVVDLLSFLP